MTELERAVLTALAAEGSFRSIPVLQYRHPRLGGYRPAQLVSPMKKLVTLGLVTRTVGGSDRQTIYRITSEGHQKLVLAL